MFSAFFCDVIKTTSLNFFTHPGRFIIQQVFTLSRKCFLGRQKVFEMTITIESREKKNSRQESRVKKRRVTFSTLDI